METNPSPEAMRLARDVVTKLHLWAADGKLKKDFQDHYLKQWAELIAQAFEEYKKAWEDLDDERKATIDSERAKAKGLVEALREIGEYTMDHCGGGEIEYIKETELFKEALKQYQGDGK